MNILPPVNILLVDDRPENLLALQAILGDLEHNLVLAHSGLEALKALLKQDFAVILLDVQMPELNGFETAELIRARPRSESTPIIFLTANDRNDAALFEGYSVGAVDFLFKPIIPQVLRSKVGVFVELFRKTMEIQQQADQLEQRVHERTADLEAANAALRIENAERQRAEEALRFLTEASTMLVSSLDETAMFQDLARLAVPRFADLCFVDMLDTNGQLERLPLEQTGAEGALCPCLNWAQRDNERPQPVLDVFSSGRSLLLADSVLAQLDSCTCPADTGSPPHTLGLMSAICVPLRADSQPVGVISFIFTQSGRRHGPQEVTLAEELAHRAGLAVHNAMLYRQAQRALRIRDDFVRVAAHELRTPIAAIAGHVQLLQRRITVDAPVNQRDLRALQTLGEQALRLNRLITSVLDISRLQSGQLTISSGIVNLQQLAQRVVEETAQTVDRHTLELSLPETPLSVQGDELRLQQVLHNLVQNAIKYSPNGGVVKVQVDRRDEQAYIAISDQGIGIPASAMSRLFGRFYRADNVELSDISGMGIGLYVVKEIVTLHRGAVVVDSIENKGSTFTVCLPCYTTSGQWSVVSDE